MSPTAKLVSSTDLPVYSGFTLTIVDLEGRSLNERAVQLGRVKGPSCHGRLVSVRGTFHLFAESESAELSVLGRDVTNNFGIIYDI